MFIVELGSRDFVSALFRNEVLQLHGPHGFGFDDLLRLSMDSIISIKFFLELDDSLVSLVESGSESDHDVSLLEE